MAQMNADQAIEKCGARTPGQWQRRSKEILTVILFFNLRPSATSADNSSEC
jgi:hypothetical protein